MMNLLSWLNEGVNKMVVVHQLFANNSLRNFIYVLEFDEKKALCIDPCNAEIVNRFVEQRGLELVGIINTHEHFDHIEGNSYLASKYHCPVFCSQTAKDMVSTANHSLKQDEIIDLDEQNFLQVKELPGHCTGHICLLLHNKETIEGVFSGDLLFNAGVGNTKGGGNLEELYKSIISLVSFLPKSCFLYPGHDYVKNNTSFALSIERENKTILNYYQEYVDAQSNNTSFVSTIAQELDVNPFLRLDSPEVLSYLRAYGLACDTPEEVFYSLRSLRDTW